MKPIILTVVLAIMQTSLTVPRQTSDKTVRGHHSTQSKANAEKNPSPSPSPSSSLTPVPPLSHPAPDQNAITQPTQANTPEPIRIGELPAVTVTTDWWYRFYVIFTGMLVAVGLVGTWLARRTLARIEEDGKQTKTLVEHAATQARAAKDAAEAALKSATSVITAERAWIVADIEAPPAYILYHIMRVGCRLRNIGKTPARIKEVAERVWVATEATPLPIDPEYSADQIHPSSTGRGAIMAPDAVMPRLVYVLPADMEHIERGEGILYIHGYVVYEDVFAEEHITNYCFYLNIPMGGADPATRMFFMSDLAGYNEAT